MSNKTDALLSRIDDPGLRAQIAAELAAAQGQRRFGLVFENHLPETVRLPRVKPRRGVKVALKGAPTGKEQLLFVRRIRGLGAQRTAECIPAHPEEGTVPEVVTHPVSDLVVVAEFGDPIYPGLTRVGEATGPDTNPEAPSHVVLNAENHHALQALQWSHAGGVDLIYIDPPYNTGNKTWQYNDHYVAEKDTFRHSKWLSFMEKRLVLSKSLLKDTGVIIVAIGDDEHHRLRMLMDQVFGEGNFIANINWQGGVSALAKHHGGGVDYMLIYGKNSERVPQFRDPKPYAPEMVNIVAEIIKRGGAPEEASAELKKFIKSKGKDIAPGLAMFNKVDAMGNIYLEGDLANSLPRPNLRYPIVNPDTGKEYQPPKNGWEIGPEKMDALISEGRIIFGNKNVPSRKKLLTEQMDQLPAPSFYKDRRAASQRLRKILGEDRFPNSKDPEVLMRWFRMVAPKDAVILDFFGGSGTTAEAVLRLNAEDGGTRQAILVTNNELAAKDDAALRKAGHEPGSAEYEAKGVFHHVTKPRIDTVVTGTREDGSAYSDGLPGRVEFFNLEYLDADRIADDRAFEAVLPMLWMRAGTLGQIAAPDPDAPWYISGNFAVLRDSTQSEAFAEALPGEVAYAYIVTNSASEFARAIAPLPEDLETIRLYEKYLTTFEINTLERA